MRFHVGFSFRLKNLVKFIIPILIGIGAYFGLPLMFGTIKVNAIVNLNTSYDFTVDEDLDSTTNTNYQNIMSDLGESTYYDYLIFYRDNDSYIAFLDKSSFHSVYVYKEYSYANIIIDDSDYPYIHFNNTTDLTQTSVYNLIKSCYVGGFDNDNACWSINDNDVYVSGGSMSPGTIAIGLTDQDSLEATLTQYYYYSSAPLYYYIDSTLSSSPDVLFKSLYINDTLIEEGDSFPTYYSLYIGEPGPDPDPEPSDKDIRDYTYWFYDNYTEYDILVNIYVLMFIYFMFNIFMKCIFLIKGVKW